MEHNITIYAAKLIRALGKGKYRQLLAAVGPERGHKISRFVNKADAWRSLMGDIITRSIICNRFDIKNSQLEFIVNKFGKPFFVNHNNFEFNISHSMDWIVCAVNSEQIGIDIQYIKEVDFGIAENYFTEQEYKDLMAQPLENRLHFFYDLWTLKESYIKAIGKGLSQSLDSFYFKLSEKKIEFKTTGPENNYHFKQYEFDNHYKLSVATKTDDFPENIRVICFEDIADEFLDRHI